jgi:hypothetical protein
MKPVEVIDIHIRIPRDRRAELHFHLEASDGMGYLEEDGGPDLGVVHTPPELVDDMLGYLQALSAELFLTIRAVGSNWPPPKI